MAFPQQIRWDLLGTFHFGGYVSALNPRVDFHLATNNDAPSYALWPQTLAARENYLVELLSTTIRPDVLGVTARAAILHGLTTDVTNAGLTFQNHLDAGRVVWYKDVIRGLVYNADLFKLTLEAHADGTTAALVFFNASTGALITTATMTREIITRVYKKSIHNTVG